MGGKLTPSRFNGSEEQFHISFFNSTSNAAYLLSGNGSKVKLVDTAVYSSDRFTLFIASTASYLQSEQTGLFLDPYSIKTSDGMYISVDKAYHRVTADLTEPV